MLTEGELIAHAQALANADPATMRLCARFAENLCIGVRGESGSPLRPGISIVLMALLELADALDELADFLDNLDAER